MWAIYLIIDYSGSPTKPALIPKNILFTVKSGCVAPKTSFNWLVFPSCLEKLYPPVKDTVGVIL